MGKIASVYSVFLTSTRLLSLVGFISINLFFCVHATPPSSSFGVWDRGSSFDPGEYPFLKGIAFNAKWADVEKQPGFFDWSILDKAMETAVSRNQFMYLSLNVGPDSPEWIYTQGVPGVYCNDQIHDSWPVYPFYPSEAYKTFFQRLITEFGKHIQSYPKAMQERIVFIQVKTGCTGDECAYKGNVMDKKYDLPTKSPAWREFRLWVFDLFVENFQKDAEHPGIALMFNNVTPESDEGGKEEGFTEEWNWVMKNAQGGVGIKIAGSARGHHLSGEKTKIEMWQPRLIDTKGTPLFARSEMDQTWQRAMFAVNLPLSFYWAALTGLQNGQSIWDISSGAIVASKKMGFDYSFFFFNKYARQIYPKTATDAFCALHKGLDAADTKAYPEEKFGQATPKNVERMMKICAAYSKQGAVVDDKDALLLGQVRQRDTQKGLNDVGWDIWPDNYGRFLYQIDADATSIPFWRVGGSITKTSSIYSRFARGFEHASGKDAMYFKLHEGFSLGNEPKVMTVTVVWYDSIKGSGWKLVYDAGKPQMKTALTVTGKGDKQWHHESVTMNDAVLSYNGTKGSDFALVNTDAKDDIFSLIEVHRGKPEAPLMLPPTDYKVSDKAPMPPKADKSGKVNQTESQTNNRIPGIFPKDACGVWCWYSWGGTPNKWNGKIEPNETYPNMRGIPIVVGWNELEPQEGIVNWDLIDNIIKKAAAHKKYVFTMVWLNPTEPDWLYENGVPKVEIKTFKTDKNFSYNAYPLDPKYKFYSERIITQLANHLRSLPDSLFKYILFHQVVEGSTGDGYCYKGDPVDPKYYIDKEVAWPAYQEYIRRFTIKAFSDKSNGLPEIPLLIHTENMEWAAREYPGFVNKKGVASHFYGMNDNKSKNATFRPWDTDNNSLHRPVFSRGEGETMWMHKWFVKDSLQNLYWSALYALDAGLDIWNIPENVLENPKLHQALDIFDKYAGYKYPDRSPVAFCALRDQLNADDKIRFPEDKYGISSRKNTDRVQKIVAEFACRGAVVEDLDKSLAGSLASRGRKGYNDVGWNCEDDDYNLYLYPIDKVATSIGWWHVGPKGMPYGLSARGFEHASGKDTLCFRFHEDFFKKLPAKVLTFRIVWLDNNKSTWSFCYDAGGKTMKTAKTFIGKGTNTWREDTVTVTDAVMKNKGPGGADIALVNTGKKDFIFHLIEVSR